MDNLGPMKPLYAVEAVFDEACALLPPALAGELREAQKLIDQKAAKRFFRQRRVASWALVADTLGNDSEAGRLLYDLGEGDGIDATSIATEIGRFRRRGLRWNKKLTFCLRKERA